MEVNSTRFPSGIPALADWLHGKGEFAHIPSKFWVQTLSTIL